MGKTRTGRQISKARRLRARCNSPLCFGVREVQRANEKRVAALVRQGYESSIGFLPASRVIAETNRRHLASNKLAKRTSKKVAGACERRPSWSLFFGATRGEGPAKRCPDAPLRGEQCPGVSLGSGSVLQALAGGWRIAR